MGGVLAGCAATSFPLDRAALHVELETAAGLGRPEIPQENPPRSAQSEDRPPAKAMDPDRPEDHGQSDWRRPSEAEEIAIIRDHLERDPHRAKQFRPRPTAVTLFGQLAFADDSVALDTGGSDPDWNDLVDSGYGIGLELSHDVIPVLQPLIGVKVDILSEDSHHIGGNGDPLILRRSRDLRTVPIYAGLRLNFPLALGLDEWFDPARAGRATGVIPFLRAAAGAAWVCGQELVLQDQTNHITTRTDFLRRGWTGFFEAAVGIEYRVREGFAVDLSAGFEHYTDMKLDREFRNRFPGTDSEPLTVFFLPRLGASFYF